MAPVTTIGENTSTVSAAIQQVYFARIELHDNTKTQVETAITKK